MRALRGVFLVAAVVTACASSGSRHLEAAVLDYNQSLRWKRFQTAAAYVAPAAQADFLARYLAIEDDLYIDSIEVQGVHVRADAAVPTADVTVVAWAYLLPSTVLQKTIMVQTWELAGGAWQRRDSRPELGTWRQAADLRPRD